MRFEDSAPSSPIVSALSAARRPQKNSDLGLAQCFSVCVRTKISSAKWNKRHRFLAAERRKNAAHASRG
jgi:hypothetical protein